MSKTKYDLKQELVEHSIVNERGCWIWQRGKRGVGYGIIRVKKGVNGQDYTHRVSYLVHKGEIPAGLFVCHHCDDRACVNPDHLFLGTAKDNSDDMVKKGRQSKGPRKLTPFKQRDLSHVLKLHKPLPADVAQSELRRLIAEFGSQGKAAKDICVDISMFSLMLNGKRKTLAWVAESGLPPKHLGLGRTLSEQEAREEIDRLILEFGSGILAAKALGISQPAFSLYNVGRYRPKAWVKLVKYN